MNIALIGYPGSGKSSFINTFLKYDALSTWDENIQNYICYDYIHPIITETLYPTIIIHSKKVYLEKYENGEMLSRHSEKHDIIRQLSMKRNENFDKNIYFIYYHPMKKNFKNYIFTDLPGVFEKNKYEYNIVKKFIEFNNELDDDDMIKINIILTIIPTIGSCYNNDYQMFFDRIKSLSEELTPNNVKLKYTINYQYDENYSNYYYKNIYIQSEINNLNSNSSIRKSRRILYNEILKKYYNNINILKEYIYSNYGINVYIMNDENADFKEFIMN